MTRATELGLGVIKPWGDSARYDFVVEQGGRFLRVQVKSTTSKVDESYALPSQHRPAKAVYKERN
jgi:PD-(D/E)XK nuclease superfamily protein